MDQTEITITSEVPDEIVSMKLARKVQKSMDIIKLAAEMSEHYYHKPLIILYSGGKDSEVLADLAIRTGANIEFVNNHTTVDAPETVYHIREQFRKWREMGYQCTVNYPTYKGKRTSMWDLILQMKILPMVWARYCCKVLKENVDTKRFMATGIRSSESRTRKYRTEFEWVAAKKKNSVRKTLAEATEVYHEDIDNSPYGDCRFITAAKKHRKLVANPILDWKDNDVWEYIHSMNINYNPLYDEGFTRVGCIGCPLANYKHRLQTFERWPKYEKQYRRVCQKLYDQYKSAGESFYIDTQKTISAQNGDEIFEWWMNIRK